MDKIFDKHGVYKNNEEDTSFRFNTSLSASEKASLVNGVSYLLVGDNYNFVLKDILIDLFIIKSFTDIDISYILSSDNMIDDVEDFLNNTNAIEIVKENMEYGLFDEIKHAIDLNIEYKTGIHRNVISDSIANLVKTLDEKISGFNVDSESLIEMMDMLNGISGELTMDKMLDAYAKSDMYKQNRE